MNTQISNKTFSFGLSLILTFLTVLASPALAQNPKAWTTIASAGVVDDGDIDEVSQGSAGVAQLNTGSTPNALATIRYNVAATDGLFVTGNARMRARFMDSGTNSRVLVSLYRVTLSTGISSKLLELDSNDYGASNAFQTQTTAQCAGANVAFDFTNYAYYVEVKLERSSTNGLAKMASVQLYRESGTFCGDQN